MHASCIGRLWSISDPCISGHLANLDRSGTVLSFFLRSIGHSAARSLSLSIHLLHAIDRASLKLHYSSRSRFVVVRDRHVWLNNVRSSDRQEGRAEKSTTNNSSFDHRSTGARGGGNGAAVVLIEG
jgi:hypothetical protein